MTDFAKGASAKDSQAIISDTGESTKETMTAKDEKDKELDAPFIYNRSISVALIQNYSLYRKANDKVLPKKRDYIGSSYESSVNLAANKGEVEAYFPNLVGVNYNDSTFLSRVKKYLNNFQVMVDELGVTFNCSFAFHHKRDYLAFKAKESQLEEVYNKTDRKNIKALKEAMRIKITALNSLESELYKVGNPVNVSEYMLYRHCMLYGDIAKDTALISSNPRYRFYFKDDNKEKELQLLTRQAINLAKRNYISIVDDKDLFNAVFVQYCVSSNIPISTAMHYERIEKETLLDRFSQSEPVKFNKIVTDKTLTIKSFIEELISRGELIRSPFNQNITTISGDFIGANMKEAIVWAMNPENKNMVESFKNKLKYK